MITAADDRSDQRRLAWAALTSCAVNLLLWVGILWVSNAHFAFMRPREQQEKFIVSSSAVHIEHRKTVPKPRSVSAPQIVAQPRTVQRPQPQPTIATPPHELAREIQRAPAQPPAKPHPRDLEQARLAEQIAQQEQAFAREAERLHAQNNPLTMATISPEQASSMRKSAFDISGKFERDGVEAILTPLKHWFDGDASCYYVRYYAQFTAGGTEQGNIPWPVCYPRTADRMLPLDRPHALPIPYPPPGFALKPGAYLTPLLRGIYGKHPNSSDD